MGLSESTKEEVFLRNILYDLTNNKHCTNIYNDNQLAPKMYQAMLSQ